jgi:hypothetical protein
MESPDHDALIAHLERTLGLERAAALRVVNEVVAYFGETMEQFVLRRHGELQDENYRNDEIFERIIAEVAERRFAAGPPTARQIRRMVYG